MTDPLDQIAAILHADARLTAEQADALSDLMRAAYASMTEPLSPDRGPDLLDDDE